MKKHKFNFSFILVIIILVVAGVGYSIFTCDSCGKVGITPTDTAVFKTGQDVEVSIAIADTKEERAEGLMHVTGLGDDEGMLFVFDKNTTGKFWMKNTLIPLDMFFITEDLEVMHIEHDVQPCEADPCPNYGSDEEFLYVIETNAGYAKQHGIDVGIEVELD